MFCERAAPTEPVYGSESAHCGAYFSLKFSDESFGSSGGRGKLKRYHPYAGAGAHGTTPSGRYDKARQMKVSTRRSHFGEFARPRRGQTFVD